MGSRVGIAAWFCALLLVGCEAPAPPIPTAKPVPPTSIPTPLPPPDVPLGGVPPTRSPTLVPTAPPTPVPTPRPTRVPSPAATPTPEVAPDPTRAAQQQYCDTAAPPAHLALPPLLPEIRITPPDVATEPLPVTGGPRQAGTDPAPRVTAPHVAVVDEASGALLYSVDPFSRQAPASITKIATVLVALEHHPDIKTVYTTTVSASALINCDGSSVMGLEPNDHVTLETLLYGMMLPSGNDAAEQVAFSLAGSRETYVAWMNERVASLHLRDTHFVTPSGMDADNHYSSAFDMALLGREAMRNPRFRTLASTRSFVGDDYYMHNLNGLLYSYDGADGVKIGYTEIAGHTIVASARRDGHRVYVSLLGSRNLTGDSEALFDWVWNAFRW